MNAILSKSKKVVSVSLNQAIKGLESGKYHTVFSQKWVSFMRNGQDQGGYDYTRHTLSELKGMQ